MQKNYYKILSLLVLISVINFKALCQTSPVSVTPLINFPPSIYLPDYYSPGSNKFIANLTLNDYNEPSRDVYLKIKIESQSVRIFTKPDYYTTSPITLYPGQVYPVSGDALEEYLNYSNIVIEGISQTEMLSRGGRLPEGFYIFCVDVYDYSTRRLLSTEKCIPSHLSQNDPPRIIGPEKGKVVPPNASQNIVFSWLNEAPVDPSNLSYKFTLHELADSSADPMQAIENKKTTIVHEEEVTTPIFNYNSSHPLLEVGKTYVFNVQAITADGRESFKNNGISEPSYFHYGFPGNGRIKLISPENNTQLNLTKEKTFSWSAPDNLQMGQTYNYEIRIAKIDSTKSYEETLSADTLLYSAITGTQTGKFNYSRNVKAHFPTGEEFIWQIKAYTGEQEIAKSDIATFGGPPCIMDFIAANEYIKVTYTDGCDLSNLSGKGKVKINKDGDEHDVWFNNISIERSGVQYYLRKGSVLGKVDDIEPFVLNPEYDRNGEAHFYPDTLRITRYEYLLKGQIKWDFPHAVDQDEAPVIKSVPTWVNYGGFSLGGPLLFPDSLGFDLLDPMNFRINFTKGSRFYIRGDHNYFIDFTGNINFPENVKDPGENTITIPFSRHDQVFNIYSNPDSTYQTIHVANKTTLNLSLNDFIFDFDNDASPEYFKDNPMWRGFYITSGTYSFKGDYEYSKQFASAEPLKQIYSFDNRSEDYAYVVSDGLYVYSDISFKGNNKLFFNTFPAYLGNFHIDVASGMTNEGHIVGEIVIPLLSDTDNFPFTCNLNQFGFMPGYLDESIENKTFPFNAGSEQEKLLLTFNRGYFADNNRLETTVTVEWPYLKVTFPNLPLFRIWGNYDIGFSSPNNGCTMAKQIRTRLNGFEITIDGIGAGRQGNAYAIGTTANIVMAEDASGENGPPVINFYSVFESSKIDEQYVISGIDEYRNENNATNADNSSGDNAIGEAIEGKATIGDAEAMMNKYQQQMREAEAEMEALIPTKDVGRPEPRDDLRREFAASIPSEPNTEIIEDPVSALTYQDLIEIIDFIAPFLEEEQQTKLLEFKELLVSFTLDELEALIEKFKDVRGFLSDMIKSKITYQLSKVTAPLKNKVDNINRKIDTAIMKGTESLIAKLEVGVDAPINGAVKLANKIVEKSPIENKEPLYQLINSTSTSTRLSLKDELRRTVMTSVRNNIINEATGIVDTVLYVGTVQFLIESLAENGAQLITNNDFKFSDINIDFEGMIQQQIDFISEKITFEYFQERITNTVNDAICGFDWENVRKSIVDDLVGGSVETFIEQKVVDAVTDLLGETAGGVAAGLAQNVEMDFSNLGQKLKDGDLSGIIKFDPTFIVIVTPVVDLQGYVKFTKDDPIWGDSFQAELNATIKKPIKLEAFSKFINGTKPVVDVSGMSEEEKRFVKTYKYWFIEAGVHGFFIPMTPIPIAITGFEGKVYHHMKRQKDLVTYYPNDSVRFGIGAGIFMADAASKGKIVKFDVGIELALLTGGFELTINGNAFIANVDKTIGGGGEKEGMNIARSLVLANGFMSYNSIEKHFLATMRVDLNTAPLLCAGGGMIIDISKDWWQFAIGTREDPNYIALLCRDTIFRGWFDINKTGLDIGLMANIGFDLKSPWINIGIAKFRGWTYFYFDLEAELVIFWKPSFTIQKGRIFIDMGAGVGIDWKTAIKSGTFTIAAVNLGGELEFATVPESYLRGKMHGSITVLNCSASMSLSANINF